MATDEEMAYLQKLSNDFQPEIEGLPIGQTPLSTEMIAAEYDQAHPLLRVKTINLAKTHPYYRTVKGDGNCGWRAIMFCYFEILMRMKDPSKFVSEEGRLMSLNNLLDKAGYEEYTYSDWVDETLSLLRQCAATLHLDDHRQALVAAFNNVDIGPAIIQHSRSITGAWMLTHKENYEPFLIDQSVEEYCALQINPHQVEIEHLGMNALIDAVIKPAGIAVEILYLDRSSGDEVNTIRFDPTAVEGLQLSHDPFVIRLLYWPGHYTILYKKEDVAEMLATDDLAEHLPTLHSNADVMNLATEHRSEQINLLTSIPFPSLGLDRTYNLRTYDNPPYEADKNDYYQSIWSRQGPEEQGVFNNLDLLPGITDTSVLNYLASNKPLSDHSLQDNLFGPSASPVRYHPHATDPRSVPSQDGDPYQSPEYGLTFRLLTQHESYFRLSKKSAPCETKTTRSPGGDQAHIQDSAFQDQKPDLGLENETKKQ